MNKQFHSPAHVRKFTCNNKRFGNNEVAMGSTVRKSTTQEHKCNKLGRYREKLIRTLTQESMGELSSPRVCIEKPSQVLSLTAGHGT